MINMIFIIGPMGVGKTAVGIQLSKDIGFDFFDTDDPYLWYDYIPNKYNNLYWDDRDKYHEIEKKVLRDCIENKSKNNRIISTGGSTVRIYENRKNIINNGIVIYLYADFDNLNFRRKLHDNSKFRDWWNNIMLTKNSREDLVSFQKDIESDYDFADLKIDTNGKSIEEISLEIQKWIF